MVVKSVVSDAGRGRQMFTSTMKGRFMGEKRDERSDRDACAEGKEQPPF